MSNRVTRWLAAVSRWLVEGNYVWMWAAGLSLVWLACRWAVPDWELRLRLAGMSLEFLGLGTVVYGLWRTRRDFRKTTLLEDVAGWLRGFPRFPPRSITLSAVGSITDDCGLGGEVTVWLHAFDAFASAAFPLARSSQLEHEDALLKLTDGA